MSLLARSLALAIASLSLLVLVRAQEVGPSRDLGLLPNPLKSRDSQLAICTYVAIDVEEPSTREYQYLLSIDLGGVWRDQICPEASIMNPILDTISLRCRDTWTREGSIRTLEGFNTTIENERCNLAFKIVSEPSGDQTFPAFVDDCVLIPKPEPCGIVAENLPWPSECSQAGDIVQVNRSQLVPDGPSDTQTVQENQNDRYRHLGPGSLRRYTMEEDAHIQVLRDTGLTWAQIAQHFPGRTATALANRYSGLQNGVHYVQNGERYVQSREFTAAEDQLIIFLKDTWNLSWREIADYLPHKSVRLVMGRYEYLREL